MLRNMKPSSTGHFETREKAGGVKQKSKILMIDDEKDFCHTMKLCLEKFGLYEVDVCSDAVEGMKKIEGKTYDVIFLDVLMPKIEGHEALAKIKSVTRTPVVILSAYISPAVESQVVRLGALACIRKPVEVDQLVLLTHKALEEKRF